MLPEGMTYPGGKNGAGIYQRIINLMPPHDVYIEPFLGGAAIMRLKLPARLNIGVDLDPNAPGLAMQPGHHAPRLAIGAGGNGGGVLGSDIAGPGAPVPPMADPLTKKGEARSRNVKTGEASSFQFLRGDGIDFLRSYSYTGRELVYCDPPYLMSTRTGRQLYRFEMTDLEHRRLLRVIRELPCRVMISGYSSVLYARELAGWNATSFAAMTRGGTERAEWLWYNFPRPLELHDYRYLGEGFRERERIKRKKARWTAKLASMPVLERQALLAAIASTAGTADGRSR